METNATLEEPKARRLTASVAEGEMALLRFGREGAPPLLFAHANGFCASAYRQMLAAIGDERDVFAVDLRGHGLTRLPADPARHRSMDVFGADIAALLDSLAGRVPPGAKWTLAGHSLGAVSVTLAAQGRRDVAALRLIEPVAVPEFWSLIASTPLWGAMGPHTPLARAARRRRRSFPDRASARASYARKALFSTWAQGVLDDYLADGLREEGGAVALACDPLWEAATFAGQAHDFWGALARAPAPVFVLAARHPSSTVPPSALRRLARMGAKVVLDERCTHLLPFENPGAAARFLAGEG